MAYFDILIRFVNEQDRPTGVNHATTGDYVELEQLPFDEPADEEFQAWYMEHIGDEYSASWSQLQNAYNSFKKSDCTGGFLTVVIHAHKSRSNLNYSMTTSKGTWQSPIPTTETEQKKESVTVSNKSYHAFNKENVVSIACAEWEGDVFDQYDELILPKPPINVSVNNPDDEDDTSVRLVFGQKCTGTIRVVRDIEYDVWTLLIEPRLLYDGAGSTSSQGVIDIPNNLDLDLPEGVEVSDTTGVDGSACTGYYESGDLEGAYASTVVAKWNGGHDTLIVEISEDQLSTSCDPANDLFGLPPGSTVVDREGDEDGKCYDLYVTRDKCTNEILSEELRQVACDEE